VPIDRKEKNALEVSARHFQTHVLCHGILTNLVMLPCGSKLYLRS